jgi:hypothetical protein
MRCEGRAIRFVATHTTGEHGYITDFFSDHFLVCSMERSTAVFRIITEGFTILPGASASRGVPTDRSSAG